MSRTSTEVKSRYNAKAYDVFRVSVRKDIAADFRARLAENDDTISSVFHDAILRYIYDSDNNPKDKTDNAKDE